MREQQADTAGCLLKAIGTLSLAHRSLLGDPAICQVPRAGSAPSQGWGEDGSRGSRHVFPPCSALSTAWAPQGGAGRSSLGGPESGHSTHCPPPTFSSPRKNNAACSPRTKPPRSLAGNRYPHGRRQCQDGNAAGELMCRAWPRPSGWRSIWKPPGQVGSGSRSPQANSPDSDGLT